MGEAGLLPGSYTYNRDHYLLRRTETKIFPPSTELLRASAGEGKYQGKGARHIDDSPPFQLDRGGVIGLSP